MYHNNIDLMQHFFDIWKWSFNQNTDIFKEFLSLAILKDVQATGIKSVKVDGIYRQGNNITLLFKE